MNMLAKIFKPKWQNKRPEVRKQAVTTLNVNNPEQNGILLQLAQEDPDQDVRLAAIDQLLDTKVLNQLVQQSPDQTIKQQAQKRLVQILDDGQPHSLPLQERLQLIKDLKDNAQLILSLCLNSEELEYQTALIDYLLDETALATVAVESKLTKIRQLAVQRVNSAEYLHHVVKQIKNRDKRVSQIAKDKLTLQRKSQEVQQSHLKECEGFCQSVEGLAKSAYNPMYSSKLQYLENQWSNIKDPIPQQFMLRFDKAAATCIEVINQHQVAENELKAAQERQLESHAEQLNTCDTLEQCVAQLKLEVPVDLNASSLNSLLEIQQRRWQEAIDGVRPHPKEQMRYQKAFELLDATRAAMQKIIERTDSLNQLLSRSEEIAADGLEKNLQLSKELTSCLNHIDWPVEIAKPEIMNKLQNALTVSESRLKSLKLAEADNSQELKNSIKKLGNAIDDGNVEIADELHRETRNLLTHLSHKEQKDFEHKINLLTGQLNELRDWKGFATNPKKEQLCVAMEALRDSDTAPKDRSDAIKSLQEEWKKLGNTRSNEEKVLWSRFKEASDAAYEPCKVYFLELQELRQYNLQQREIICEQLETYLANNNWIQPDWKAVDKIIHTAKKEWLLFAPVDRTKIKGVQNRFNRVIQPLTAKLNAEKDKNIELKIKIVSEAQLLLEQSDAHEASNAAKALQRKWQDIGLDHRAKGQKLWKEYRSVCDNIFQRVENELKSSEQEQQNNLAVAQEISDKVNELAALEDQKLASSQKEFAELCEAFKNVGALPRSYRQDIHQQFNQICSNYRERFSGLSQRAKTAQFTEMERKAELCERLEAGKSQELIDQLSQQWSAHLAIPETFQKAIETRWHVAQDLTINASSNDLASNAAERRLLCIRLEILAGLESPKEDEKQRMEYQVNRLTKGIGQTQQDTPTEISEIRGLWCGIGATEHSLLPALKARYQRAIQKLC